MTVIYLLNIQLVQNQVRVSGPAENENELILKREDSPPLSLANGEEQLPAMLDHPPVQYNNYMISDITDIH